MDKISRLKPVPAPDQPRIVLEKLGLTGFQSGGSTGTVSARDLANGEVSIDVVTSAGVAFAIHLADPFDTLSAVRITTVDFIFA
jgi:hypothetical protein